LCFEGDNVLSKREQYEKRTEQILAPIMEAEGFELVDTEFVKEGGSYYLRAYIDKPGGITIDDCEKVSRQLSDRLDEEDFVEESYILEVSSPGLGRKLKKDKDLQRSLGEAVELRFYKPVNGIREASGILKAWDADTVTIGDEDEEIKINRADIALIRLAIDF
jgi:ribosome maturation factor RimP